jgi:dephospho-CoA kinase
MPGTGHFPSSHCRFVPVRTDLAAAFGWYRAPVVVVAITGGIGSGKSTVAALLADRGAVVIDADQIARQVVAPDGPAYRAVVEHFGPEVVAADGALDRAAIAARVFSDPEELAALNAITHPAIGATIGARLASVSGSGRPVVIDLPLVSEATRRLFGLAGLVVVDAPVEVAARRLVDQRGLTAAEADARIQAQITREQRRRWADVVVDNGGTREQLEASVEQLWLWLEGLDSSGAARSVDGPAEEAPDADHTEEGQEGQ